MTKLALCVVIAAVVLFRGLDAFEFDHQPEDGILEQWLKEEMANTQAAAAMEAADLGFPTPGHVEEQEFMSAFFENQDHGAFADVVKSDNHVDDYLAEFFSYGENEDSYAMFAKIGGGEEEDEVDADRGVAGTQEAERVVGRGHTEDWLGDFSEQPEETSESDDDDYFLGDVQEHYEDIFGTDQGEAPSDDLDLWLQAMVEPEEEEAEDEEDEGTLIGPAFGEFPDDDLFPEAAVQAAARFDPKCLAWKQSMTAAQASVNAQGKVLQATISALEAVIKNFRKLLKVQCQKKCGTICMPVDDGEECLDRVNGTCILTAPKTKDCGEQIRDPECDMQEADCEAGRKEIADKVKKLRDEQDEHKDTLDNLTKKLFDVMNSAPEQCLKAMEAGLQAAIEAAGHETDSFY